MAQYSISDLKNKITDRIHENHERAITGPDLQEMLHDILDSVSAAGSGGISEKFPGWHGQEFAESPNFYCYLGEYQILGSAPANLFIRAKTPEGSGSIILNIRAWSDSNQLAGSDALTLTEEYTGFLLDLPTTVPDEPLMIQYKSSQSFQVKEIILF